MKNKTNTKENKIQEPNEASLPKDGLDKDFRSGFVAIIGRPNVGKSTLLNAILGEKISIVSRKPQTTRNVIRGVKHFDGGQIVFIDTPGVHKTGGRLNAIMVREALGALHEVDCVAVLVSADKPPGEMERYMIEEAQKVKCPVVLVVNKIDLVGRDSLLPLIERYSKLFDFSSIIPVSALKQNGIDEFVSVVKKSIPKGPRYFPEDMVTDSPERFIAAEIVREKVFRMSRNEIPYSVAVIVEEFKEKKKKNLISIRAVINVERDSQKGIIIGKGGAMLKKIGSAAREDLEALLGVKVFLELFVRVSKGWSENARSLKEFGYE
ncbi:MAG: GTPase Era [Deltaproteobacteria bacterium]|nr:GTPase Era [Deltaproteobacteria bacterium]